MMNLRALEAEFKPKVHKALRFDGVDDYVEVYDSASLRGIGNEITVMVWINLLTLTDGSAIGKWSSWVNGEWLLWSKTARPGEFAFGVATENGYTIADSGVVLEVGKWYLLTGVYDGSRVKIYINGEQSGTTPAITGKILSTTNNVYVGGKSYLYLNCLISLVYIYKKALSESEIKYLYHNPFDPPELEHLVLWLAPGSIDLANGKWWDLSGKGNHGIIYGCNEVLLTEPEVAVV